ncbi:PREDICTED: tetratricopeptide repeat protein 6 [Nipponia nippon]|nr:PREDICTED: tetratricopeptide repeat protein 6 [Nipponia nippon]
MGSTLALEPFLPELFLSTTITAKRPPSPDQPDVGGGHPLFFLHLLLPGTQGLDPPGRTRRALQLPCPAPPPAGPCLPAACFSAAGCPPFQPPPPGAGGSGGPVLPGPRPRGTGSAPGRCRACRAFAGHAQGAPFMGAVRGPGGVVWLVAKVRIFSEVRDMKKQTPDLRVMTQRNKSVEEDGADKNQRSCSEKVNRENATCSHKSKVVKLPVIASFAGTTKKIVMVKHSAPPQKPSYCRSNFHVNSSPIPLEKTKAVSKVKDRVRMLQMDPQNLKRDKTEEIDTVIKDSDEFSSTDSDTIKNISRKGKISRESCKKRSRVISKAKQQDLGVESGRVLRKGSKQPSVRSAREQLEEARDVTRPDTSKIYEKNFQQSKPEEPTSTPALPVKVVARSIDEIIASLQSTSPSPSDQTIKELLESVLGQNYNIKMEAPIEHEEIKTESQVLPSFHEASLKSPIIQKESQAKQNESQPKDELLTYNKQVKQAPSLDVLQVEGKAISKIKPDEVQKELQEEHDLQRSLPPQASNVESVSLGRLPVHDKISIKVSPAIKQYQSPSIPCLLDFEKFAKARGGIPKETSARMWVSGIWNCWFDENFPPSGTASEEKDTELLKGTETVDSQEANPQIELVDSMQPVLLEGATVSIEDLEKEVRRLTELIEKEEHPSAFHYCRRGAIQRKLGKLKSAMDDLEKAISLEPLLLNAYWHRHLIYLFQDRISAALDDLNFITKWSKNKADTYLSMAEIYRKQGDNTLAIINYSSAIQCSPTDDDIYCRRAELYFEENQLLLAMDDYAKCFQYNPKRTDALMKHGIHFFDHSVLTIAIQDFTAVIKEDPSNAQARLYRGRAYAKQQQYRNAIQDLAAAVHLDPSCWLAFYYRGCVLRQIDPQRAVQDFSVSVLINDTQENFCSFLHRGILYSEQCQWSLAICDFESVLALDSSVIFAYLNIGLILLLHLDQYYEAIRQFTNAIEIDPLNVRAYVCRAQAYHKIRNLPNAVKDINRAIHLYPNKSQLCMLRGQYLMELKKYELASLCIHQLAEMNEESFTTQPVQQALIQSFCQNHNKAIECLREATATQPEPSMFVILGKIQMKAKKTKDALRSFKKAMKLLMTSAKILPNTFEAAEMYYRTGLCYMEQKCLLRARDAFSMAIRLHSSYPDAFYQRGLCRMQLGQAKCIRDFNRALALCPSHFQAYMSLAAYYGSKGRYSKAILNCNEAIKILPNSVRAYFYRGTLKYQNKTFKAAIEDLSKTIDLNKTCILAYYNRAVCYHQTKDFRKSLKDYGILLLLELSKEIAFKVLINRGLLYMELGDYANACEDFKEATLLSPDNSQIFQALGICYHRLHEFEEAVRSFDQVLKLDPVSVDAYVGRGNLYMENGCEAGCKQAQKDFLRAIHLNPKCIKARICLGYNLQALGKLQRAWNQFTVAICIDPKCCAAYDGRASVCLQMGETFAAFQDTNAALKLTTTAPLLTNRGVINQLMGYLPCAMKDYQQAISVDPNYALAYFNAANIYFHNRQFSQAYCYYSKVLQLDPRNESAVMNRAITNTLLNNIEEAKEDFEKAICLCPFSAAVYFNRANFYNGLKQYELAEKDISTALSIQPNDALMYKFRADIRGKLGFNKEAVEDYKQAISIQEQIDSM